MKLGRETLGKELLHSLDTEGFVHIREPMDPDEFETLACRLGHLSLRTDLVIDAGKAVEEEKIRSRTLVKKRQGVYQPEGLGLHTDRPTEQVLGWYCVEQDAVDGALLLVDTKDLADRFSESELSRLSQIRLTYTIRDPVSHEEQIFYQSLLSQAPGGLRQLYYVPWLLPDDCSTEQFAALHKFAGYLRDKQENALVRVRLKPGECLFIDNRRCLHGREALSKHSNRHLIRLYIRTPEDKDDLD